MERVDAAHFERPFYGLTNTGRRVMFQLLREARLRSLPTWIADDEHAHAHRCVRVSLGGPL